MSIWASVDLASELLAFDVDYNPAEPTLEVDVAYTSWNDCVRLSIWRKDTGVGAEMCMLSIDSTRELIRQLTIAVDRQEAQAG